MNLNVKVLREPRIECGGCVVGSDPKAALAKKCGPFLGVAKGQSEISLGLVALGSEVDAILDWFSRMERLIVSDESNALRFPAFQGVQETIGARFKIDPRLIYRLPQRDYDLATAEPSARDRFEKLLDLYVGAVGSLGGDAAPKCILVSFPEEVAGLSISNPALTLHERQVLEKMDAEEKDEQLELFAPSAEELEAASELMVQSEELLSRNFHRAFKAACMRLPNPIPTQVLRRQAYIKTEAKQSEATRAWNLSIALLYKTGHIPWRPADLPSGTCFAGVSFHHLKQRGGNMVYCSVAHAFSNDTEPFILRGASIPHQQTRHKRPYLLPEQAGQIMASLIDGYVRRAGSPPTRIVIHKTSQYQPEEEKGFRESALQRVANIGLVWLRPTGFRLLRRGMTEPIRGTLCRVGADRSFLFTTGYVPWWEEYPGPHIPSPIELGGDADLEARAAEILSLTKMNWNSADGIGRFPITLSFARRVGMIMTELDENTDPNPSYRFYM